MVADQYFRVVTDASFKNGYAGCGLVFFRGNDKPLRRAHSYQAASSFDAEYEGIRLALAWLDEHGPGLVLCDCTPAVLSWQGRVRDEGLPHRVEWLRNQERDDSYQVAHLLSVRAREGATTGGPTTAKAPRPPVFIKPGQERSDRRTRILVVIDDIHTLDDFAIYFQRLPQDVTPSVYTPMVHNGQAMFITMLSPVEQLLLEEALTALGIGARLYPQS